MTSFKAMSSLIYFKNEPILENIKTEIFNPEPQSIDFQ